jgi:hypothetical protein
MNLPDNHEAWAYMNPTMFYFDEETSSQNLHERQAQHVKDFKNWLDDTLFINHEFKEKTKFNHIPPSQNDTANRAATIEGNTFNIDPQKEQGSSSVDEKPVDKINWGERQMEDNEKALDLWLRTNIPKTEKKNGDINDDSYLEEMPLCFICEKEMPKLNHGINTCQRCLQWIKESTDLINKDNEEEDNFEKGNATRNQGDDKIEFHRIPIAGENESDYEDSDEYEEEEDSTFPYLYGEDLEEANSTDTEDSEFQNVPVVIALSGPTADDQEHADGQEDSDTEDDGITISTMFNETEEEQQNMSSATPPSIFTTPENRNTKSILALLKQATQKRKKLITFDASTAFIQGQTTSVSLQKSDDIAFLVGPRRDGIIKTHQLSPIPLHDNTYQPLYIKDAEPLLTFHTNETTLDQSASVDKNENDKHLNKKKRKKKTPDAITQNKRKNLDFDFTDEGYPLALFQFGGEQMKNDYETNKRSRTPSPTSSTDSKASLIEIYYKALRTYPPEIDESNAESAERTKLIDQKINQLKQNRIKRKE